MKKRLLILLIGIIFISSYAQEGLFSTSKNIDSSLVNLEKSSIDTSSNLPKTNKTNNSYTIIRTSLGANGFSKTLTTSNGVYIISQSVGQQSPIGTFNKKGYTLRQGYQNPPLSAKIIELPDIYILNARIYPNPFYESINILFYDVITSDIFIYITDMTGKTILSTKLSASQQATLQLDHISSGLYIIKVTAENKQFIANLMKH